MTPDPKKRGQHHRRSNDLRGRGRDKQDDICTFQRKGHSKDARSRCQDNVLDSRRNIREENEVQNTEISDEINSFMKKYSKRTLDTNWDKYEEKSEKSNELTGMDFQMALNCSSSAASQLRLEEERVWDEEFLKIDSNDLTSINCDNLVQVLECIPFHDRLGISENFFMDSMVNEFNNDAKLQRKIYIPPKTSRMALKQTELKNNRNLQKENDVKNIIESLTNCLILKDEVKDDKNKTYLADKDGDDDNDDDTLEMLLALSEKKHKNVSEKLTVPSHPESSNVQNKPTEKALEKSDMSLNDWLDSIMED